jgi:hypothetical protein
VFTEKFASVIPLAVTAEVAPSGLITFPVKVTLQLLPPVEMTQVGDDGVRVPDITGLAEKLAVTVQAPVIAPVVNVLPESDPLQPEAEAMKYPEFGVTVKVVVEPWLTVCEAGEIEPLEPTLVETV